MTRGSQGALPCPEHGLRVCAFSLSLPEYFVVPSSLADQDLKTFSHSFVGRRMPVSDSCWVSVHGCLFPPGHVSLCLPPGH